MKKIYAIYSVHYWHAYWITMRPYLMFLSGISGLVGLAQTHHCPPSNFWLFFFLFFLSYGLGQALTDVFQIDTDSISSPYRPLTQGVISRKQVLITSLLGLLFLGFILFQANVWTLPFTLLAVCGLATYTPFKKHWWGGPFWNAWIVALLPFIAFIGAEDGIRLPDPLLASMLSVFFSYAIFVLLGYFKDISADKTTGYQTFPVRFGWRPGIMVSFLFLVLAVIFSIQVMQNSNALGAAWFLWIAGLLCFIWSHLRMWSIIDEAESFHAIEWTIRGYMLMHAAEVVAFKAELLTFTIIFYSLFEIVLRLRPERKQI